jgi:hypothetical protein
VKDLILRAEVVPKAVWHEHMVGLGFGVWVLGFGVWVLEDEECALLQRLPGDGPGRRGECWTGGRR